jgi:hypothetical protein
MTTTTGQPTCNCFIGKLSPYPLKVHVPTCPVYEPPLTQHELRQLRLLLAQSNFDVGGD